MHWVREAGHQLREAPEPEEIPEVTDLDDLQTFVGNKRHKLWIGCAVNHSSAGILAWAIALKPEVVLMDEPCSSLDPVSTERVEDLIHELKEDYTIVIVTHNMHQATRLSDFTAFFNAEESDDGSRFGYLVEYNQTERVFEDPQEEATQKYVSGKFG